MKKSKGKKKSRVEKRIERLLAFVAVAAVLVLSVMDYLEEKRKKE